MVVHPALCPLEPLPMKLTALIALPGGLAAGVLASCLLAACSTTEHTTRSDDEVADLILHRQYGEAVALAREEYDEHPDSARLERRYKRASIAFLMEQGRRATFEDKDEEAVQFFEQALELDPEAAQIHAWVEKTHLKLADRWLERALELHAQGHLEAAVTAYESSLLHMPGHPSAVRGIVEATLQINYRAGLADDYYNQGVRTLHDYWLERSRRNFEIVDKYHTDTSVRLDKRRSQVESYLADERATVALGLEHDGLYDAARNEYRLCLVLNPEHTGARAGFDRMDRESRAATFLRDARMKVLRQEFEDARELIAKGTELTERQTELFEGLLDEIDSARAETAYQLALNLERDFKYPKAIEAYGALLDEFDYYKDALARKGTLEDYVVQAPRYYAEAEAESDPHIKLGLFRAVRDVWPEYRDVEARIARLEKQLGEEQ